MLEVTESYLADDLRIPLEILTRLHINRFHLSIDDFGTGNSSLSQLTEIPFDELKIDQRFVHGAHNDSTRCAAFDASLGLAKQLHMEAVAEGVEDRADWDFLKNKGCDIAQGYFISKALAPSEIGAWLASWELRCVELMGPVKAVVRAGYKH
jgi:EAL domain-containing protein (putative c-di-GMP-specific phosphodiesterase class I)